MTGKNEHKNMQEPRKKKKKKKGINIYLFTIGTALDLSSSLYFILANTLNSIGLSGGAGDLL